MLKGIGEFLERYTGVTTELDRAQSIRMATAVLLVEVMQADDDVTESEREAVTRAMARTFDLSGEALRDLVRDAETRAAGATSLHDFTTALNAQLSYEEKVQVIGHMWEVAYADGDLDKYEEYLIRKTADLLYVTHVDFIQTKLQVHPEPDAH